jgi:protein-S-isoprenylcysteine O-methyltransferase Ste14
MTMTTGFSDRGGWWVVAQSVLMLAIGVLAPLFRSDWPGGLELWLGSALILGGAALGILGAVALGRYRTAYPMPISESPLIQHGIYGRVRHPLYSCLVLLGLGWSVGFASAVGLSFTFGLVFLLHLKAAFEEKLLRIKFPDYGEYERRVPRFVPRFFGRHASRRRH